jgi:hypothetical protein
MVGGRARRCVAARANRDTGLGVTARATLRPRAVGRVADSTRPASR